MMECDSFSGRLDHVIMDLFDKSNINQMVAPKVKWRDQTSHPA